MLDSFCKSSVIALAHEQTEAPSYRTTNLPDDNAALSKRSLLLIWLDPEMQYLAARTSKRDRQPVFTDAAIQACVTLKAVFGLSLRQTTGMVASLLELANRPFPRLNPAPRYLHHARHSGITGGL